MKIVLLLFLSLFIVLTSNQLSAQSFGTLKKVPFSIGVFPPVSTNGTNAGNCVNRCSIGLISDYTGALAGVEISGFSNTVRDFAYGSQFAGFLNFVGGEFIGFQFSGFGNFNRGKSTGFQFAGFANFNYAEANGVLAAGFANFTNGKSLAIQMAGFANFCEDVQGTQLAGLTNVVKGNGKATQISGFSNVMLGQVNGVQLAGFGNFAKINAKGAQIAGFTNISTGNLQGAQIAGFLNIAKKVNGLQLGVINIADSIESGIPIGFLSIVKDGFREFEIAFGESLNAQATVKIGIDKFYNIFSVGTQFISNELSWGFGYGLGTHLTKNENFKTQLELMSYHINEGEAWTNNYNDLQQLKLIVSKKLSDEVSVFVGPTANLMITNNKENPNFVSEFAPYSFYSHQSKNATLKGWFGLTAGIHIN